MTIGHFDRLRYLARKILCGLAKSSGCNFGRAEPCGRMWGLVRHTGPELLTIIRAKNLMIFLQTSERLLQKLLWIGRRSGLHASVLCLGIVCQDDFLRENNVF